jgi:hypothetical protein
MIYFRYIIMMNYGHLICVVLNFKFILFKSYTKKNKNWHAIWNKMEVTYLGEDYMIDWNG